MRRVGQQGGGKQEQGILCIKALPALHGGHVIRRAGAKIVKL